MVQIPKWVAQLLSGGQAARVALARALYFKRPLLVLDDLDGDQTRFGTHAELIAESPGYRKLFEGGEPNAK